MLKTPQHLACPVCKSSLKKVDFSETVQGRMKFGGLVCETCDRKVGEVSFGKIDFIRTSSDFGSSPLEEQTCHEFTYRRIPWTDSSVAGAGVVPHDLGWTSEGFWGVLFADSKNSWEITIQTEATDVGIRCLSHSWSGAINVTINDLDEQHIDLYDESEFGIKLYVICKNLDGPKTIKIRSSSDYKSPHDNQFFFSGYDACFNQDKSTSSSSIQTEVNRGNGYPPMYEWILKYLPENGLVLDCGAGDRRFKDSRYVGFEYLPFELPDIFGDGHALPFADNVFDVVFSQAVMEHMRDPYLAAREIARILKPGGLVYVESAFMQPLHAVPYHFFNTTPWGIEALFVEAGLSSEEIEWFGPLSGSVKWYIDACSNGKRKISRLERKILIEILKRFDRNTDYESLKAVASAVAFWGVKPGGNDEMWKKALKQTDRPTFKY
jgi:SAM-dependent methyltransferase